MDFVAFNTNGILATGVATEQLNIAKSNIRPTKSKQIALNGQVIEEVQQFYCLSNVICVTAGCINDIKLYHEESSICL